MKFRLLISSLAAAAVMCPVPAFAATTAIKRIGADEAMALCPSIGSTGLKLGEPVSRQNGDLAAHHNKLSPQYAPFTEADLEFTPWSGRLAGVTYLAASPDGDENLDWGKQLEDSLRQAGWVDSTRRDLTSSMALDPKPFEKQFETPEGPRTIFLEFDISGALMLRCGDAGLLEASRNERDGRLEPGTPRPAALSTGPVAPLPTEADCANPEVLEAFKVAGRVDETVPALRRMTEGGLLLAEQKRQSERLHTWLSWKLRTSGRMNEEQIWKIEEAADSSADAKSDAAELIGLLGEVGKGFEDGSNPEASCKSLVGLMVSLAKTDKREIARWTKINHALEAEARKHGIDVE